MCEYSTPKVDEVLVIGVKTALQQHLVCQEWPNEGLKISSFRRLNSCIYAARNLEIEDEKS